MVLDASGSSCPATPSNCTLQWSLYCIGRENLVQAAGATFTITTGAAVGRTVNTARSTGVTCVATVSAIDGNRLTNTTAVSIRVRGSHSVSAAQPLARRCLLHMLMGRNCGHASLGAKWVSSRRVAYRC